MKKVLLLCGLLLAAAAPSAFATKLRTDRQTLDFDPNQPIWHVSSRVCNKDQVPSGTLRYDLWLYQESMGKKFNYYKLGGLVYKNAVNPNDCRDKQDMAISINYKTVPVGQYHIQMTVAEWNGQKWVTVSARPFYLDDGRYQDFIRN